MVCVPNYYIMGDKIVAHFYICLMLLCLVLLLFTVHGITLLSLTNGKISCDFTGVPHHGDHCSFSCDNDYQWNGPKSRQCLPNGSCSGSNVTCIHVSYKTNITYAG